MQIKKRFAARILARATPYTSALDTDIRKTFDRVRREQQAAAAPAAARTPAPAAAPPQQGSRQVVQLHVPAPSGFVRRQRGAITVDDVVALAALACLALAGLFGGLAP